MHHNQKDTNKIGFTLTDFLSCRLTSLNTLALENLIFGGIILISLIWFSIGCSHDHHSDYSASIMWYLCVFHTTGYYGISYWQVDICGVFWGVLRSKCVLRTQWWDRHRRVCTSADPGGTDWVPHPALNRQRTHASCFHYQRRMLTGLWPLTVVNMIVFSGLS